MNRPPPTVEAEVEIDVEVNIAPPKIGEIISTIKSLKNRKAPAQDNLNTELFQVDLELTAKMQKEKKIPKHWTDGIIMKMKGCSE